MVSAVGWKIMSTLTAMETGKIVENGYERETRKVTQGKSS